MTERWLDERSEGVWRFVLYVTEAALNPWLRLVAVAGTGERRRGDATTVRVVDLDAAREVVAFDAPGPVRKLAWTSPHHLLVIRGGGEHPDLTLHELPDGGAVGVAAIQCDARNVLRAECSLDGARLMVTAGGNPFLQSACVPHVFSLPALDRLAVATMRGHHGRPVLHPDGGWIAYRALGKDRTRIDVAPIASAEPARTLFSHVGRMFSPRWLDARTLAAHREHPRGGADVVVLACDGAFGAAQVRATHTPAERPGRDWYLGEAPHPEGDRILVSYHGDDDHLRGRGRPLEVLQLPGGERTPLDPLRCWGGVRWALGGAALAFIDARRSLAVVRPGAVERAVTASLPIVSSTDEALLEVGGPGGGFVMVASPRARGTVLTFADAARLAGA